MRALRVLRLVVFSASAWAQNESAGAVIFDDQQCSCGKVGADDNFCTAGCAVHLDRNADGWIDNRKLCGKVPGGAALPKKALRGPVQDSGWDTCRGAVGGTHGLSPSGQFTYNRRD